MVHDPGTRSVRSASSAVTAEGEAFASVRLRYTSVQPPATGTSVDIAPGVGWARIPLPMELDHINVWLVDAGDGCVVVDTGIGASVGKDAWEALATETLANKPVRAIVVTHIHPDHIGLAAWLQERHGVPVLMSQRTRELATVLLLSGADREQMEEAERFFRSHGIVEAAQMQQMFKPDRFVRVTSGMPHVERVISDGEVLSWRDAWSVMETNGHAEGHLCLLNAAERVLISGDQVLPTISSNIGFIWHNGDKNPLSSYLASLRRLRTLDSETLVLPSHGLPFVGLQHRIDDLISHHEEKLATLQAFLTEPRTGVDVLPLMYRRELRGMHLFLALTEALAHLEYLVHAGRAERLEEKGVIRYVSGSRKPRLETRD